MILVVASQRDPGAAALVAGWAGARLLTPADLSLPGWVLPAGATGPGDPPGRGVADGEPFEVDRVGRVVCLLARVRPAELTWIADEHRGYVAAEMTALLGHWLAGLGDRCVVRPTPGDLAGPTRPTTAWAAAAGLPVAERSGSGSHVVVTVVGRRVVVGGDGPAPGPAERRGLVAAAAAHDAPLLSAVLTPGGPGEGLALEAVLPAPLVATPAARAAVRRYVASGRPRTRERVAS
ncbi:hypothetical protein L615_003000000490 [Nocardioides sp. J9]|uniref:hypothetical protein n=1 Tax=unclassified Nocardioides TaxID=2615069 RepID=UPI0004B10675|nr:MULTISPECIES: hypothetical protein [unclassified Nocardioides]TWG98380.1 hypothetical protein L615_003000000490 [Nocardioides sp. J9]